MLTRSARRRRALPLGPSLLPVLLSTLRASVLLGSLLLGSVLHAESDVPGLAPAPDAGSAPKHSDQLQLLIDSPSSGTVVESTMHMAEVRGRAVAPGQGASSYDVMLVIDVSYSTRSASGADVDGDGEVGENPQLGLFAPGEYPDDVWSTDPGDTILHAEISAARALLDSLEGGGTRVGLVTFSGEVDPDTGRQKARDQLDATLQVPLTPHFDVLHAALDQIATREPRGATNFAAGIRLATTELAGFSTSKSEPRPDARKVVLFLTDGFPSFPVGRADTADPGDLEAAVNAARVAHSAGIRINTFAVGPDALTKPKAATEVARVTLGTFTPVLEPGAIAAALQSVSFANVEDVGVVNLTTREDAPDVRLNPDGSFVAFVPVKQGPNRVLVNALASNGSETNVELDFEFRVKQDTDERMREQELARLRRINNELIRHLEAERIKAERRRRRMERVIEIEAVKE